MMVAVLLYSLRRAMALSTLSRRLMALNGYVAGGDVWANDLRSLIEERYEPLFKIDLYNATPAEFNEVFRASYPAKENVLRKCITFFLNAAREADIAISPGVVDASLFQPLGKLAIGDPLLAFQKVLRLAVHSR